MTRGWAIPPPPWERFFRSPPRVAGPAEVRPPALGLSSPHEQRWHTQGAPRDGPRGDGPGDRRRPGRFGRALHAPAPVPLERLRRAVARRSGRCTRCRDPAERHREMGRAAPRRRRPLPRTQAPLLRRRAPLVPGLRRRVRRRLPCPRRPPLLRAGWPLAVRAGGPRRRGVFGETLPPRRTRSRELPALARPLPRPLPGPRSGGALGRRDLLAPRHSPRRARRPLGPPPPRGRAAPRRAPPCRPVPDLRPRRRQGRELLLPRG